MAVNRLFVIALITMLVALFGSYLGSITSNEIGDIDIDIEEDLEAIYDHLWVGAALFINYLLLVCFFAPETSPLLKNNNAQI